MNVDWQADLDRWLAPFVAALRHRTRARMCPAYVAGLIGPGDRNSIQSMAVRADEVGYDQLHHFVSAGVWDSAPLEAALLKEADDLVGDEAGFLVIDDTALPKKGRHSVGHKHRMLDSRMQFMPGDEVWLVGERRSTGEQKYYVSDLPADTTVKTQAATIKARWICEQAHQQLKEELGLDHFEGRYWKGLHRHALMTMIAYAQKSPSAVIPVGSRSAE